MPVYRLTDDVYSFPHPSLAEPGGLLAIGGDLNPQRLVVAYSNGIFPWFEEDGTYFWYSPAPRCVLFPAELRIHKSMRSIFNGQKFHYTLDMAFEEVLAGCAAATRAGQDGTWISAGFQDAYQELHRLGVAHSVEVWQDGYLAGGLYGLSIGRIFFGESMFARVPNASKAGFTVLTKALEQQGFWLIDCQQETAHLTSLGATMVEGRIFWDYLARNAYQPTLIGPWRFTETGGIGLAEKSDIP
jgi:leucyl/phenylalanyl-tRNA---protein transferase